MNIVELYVLFMAKTMTVIMGITILLILMRKIIQRKKLESGHLQLTHLGDQYHGIKNEMLLATLPPRDRKKWQKEQKKHTSKLYARCKTGRENKLKRIIYVMDFTGSMDAKEVNSLREEISAVLLVATNNDQVLLRLESNGGTVHNYGLAASQLQRLRNQGIFLTVAVDKIAASGGYLMACVANQIIAAPFAVIGSIGVMAQFPNFNRWLKRNDIDFELHTAGEYKRTLTLFGENSEQGRQKFREELSEIHQLFKRFVHEMRPALDMDLVATGEHWLGRNALEKGLIDAIGTSDEFILKKIETCELMAVHYVCRQQRWIDKLSTSIRIGKLLWHCLQFGNLNRKL
ncbi:MAG: protease SohB [Candidatus Dasytiphilus stammeri]